MASSSPEPFGSETTISNSNSTSLAIIILLHHTPRSLPKQLACMVARAIAIKTKRARPVPASRGPCHTAWKRRLPPVDQASHRGSLNDPKDQRNPSAPSSNPKPWKPRPSNRRGKVGAIFRGTPKTVTTQAKDPFWKNRRRRIATANRCPLCNAQLTPRSDSSSAVIGGAGGSDRALPHNLQKIEPQRQRRPETHSDFGSKVEPQQPAERLRKAKAPAW
jgi:hypothetical protein